MKQVDRLLGQKQKIWQTCRGLQRSLHIKTRSWNGSIDDRLGASKVIKGNGFTVDRDINGARNIFIKNLTRQLEPEIITTNVAFVAV
ncbi:hypothetical protein [Endozoicomonas acroporae]|uniref:hypothetical protein n=1 Tax=Endozoicomonas acroporae TaxID=1701104 RepID=UPI0013D4EB0C|nr:hypothetical protein [Endozoicomonas acroporae]